MKKLIAIMMISLMTISLFTGCGAGTSDGKGEAESTQTETFKTIADITDYTDSSFVFDEKTFVFVFTSGDVTYRATCDMPEDISKAMSDLEVSDEDFADKAKETAGPLEIARLENLTEGIPPQEELDQLVGKTGQDLIDDGWGVWSWETETMEFGMSHGPYNFKVVFDGKIEGSEDMDAEKEIAALKVKSVTYDGIGDAATIEQDYE